MKVRSLSQPTYLDLFQFAQRFLIISRRKPNPKKLLYFTSGVGLTLLWSWNWPLVLATGVGSSSMFVLYWLGNYNWQKIGQQGQKFLALPQGKLTLAVGGGIGTALATYLGTAVVSEMKNPTLAIAFLVQGAMILLILAILIGQNTQESQPPEQDWLLALGDSNPVKRLLAVRHLSELLENSSTPRALAQQIPEYFQLMLTQEEHPQVKKALLEGLKLKPLEPLALRLPIPFAQASKLLS